MLTWGLSATRRSTASELSSPSPPRLAVSAAVAVFVAVLIRPVFAVLVALTLAANAKVLDQGDACSGDQHRRHKHENDVPDAHDYGRRRPGLSRQQTTPSERSWTY